MVREAINGDNLSFLPFLTSSLLSDIVDLQSDLSWSVDLKIALLGTRGIPARYGGFETFAEELSRHLTERGHEVTVYARHPFGSPNPGPIMYEGVQVVSAPTIMNKYLETPVHALTSFIDLFRRRFDVVLLCNAANAPFAWLVRLKGFPLAINVDGIERKRAKWNALGRLWYRIGERTSLLFGTRVIADAEAIASYYQETYNRKLDVIAYGAKATVRPSGVTLETFGLKERGYLLYVSRLEPENNALGVIQAYAQAKVDMPLVIVGDAPYADAYKQQLRAAATEGVVFSGFQFGEAYQELQSNCYLYIQATEVGGTHPALIESMAYGNCIIANGTPENREVLGDAGEFYDKNNFMQLAHRFNELVGDREKVERYRSLAQARARERYTWEGVTDQYEGLFREMIR